MPDPVSQEEFQHGLSLLEDRLNVRLLSLEERLAEAIHDSETRLLRAA
jgi:hypothetical protein